MLSVLMKIIIKIRPYYPSFTGYVIVTFLKWFIYLFFAESEQAGVRPGQSTAEENRAGHRALHHQRKWGFTTTGFCYIIQWCFWILNQLLPFDRDLKQPCNDLKPSFTHTQRNLLVEPWLYHNARACWPTLILMTSHRSRAWCDVLVFLTDLITNTHTLQRAGGVVAIRIENPNHSDHWSERSERLWAYAIHPGFFSSRWETSHAWLR